MPEPTPLLLQSREKGRVKNRALGERGYPKRTKKIVCVVVFLKQKGTRQKKMEIGQQHFMLFRSFFNPTFHTITSCVFSFFRFEFSGNGRCTPRYRKREGSQSLCFLDAFSFRHFAVCV